MSQTKSKGATDGTEKKLRNLVPFKPGQSGNPKGRPKGARNRLGTQFLEALEADFNQFGAQATPSAPERCATCGGGERPCDRLLPLGTDASGHAWLHRVCWPAWHQAREAEAIAALASIGIRDGFRT